jgi:hypothetical protein
MQLMVYIAVIVATVVLMRLTARERSGLAVAAG